MSIFGKFCEWAAPVSINEEKTRREVCEANENLARQLEALTGETTRLAVVSRAIVAKEG